MHSWQLIWTFTSFRLTKALTSSSILYAACIIKQNLIVTAREK